MALDLGIGMGRGRGGGETGENTTKAASPCHYYLTEKMEFSCKYRKVLRHSCISVFLYITKLNILSILKKIKIKLTSNTLAVC